LGWLARLKCFVSSAHYGREVGHWLSKLRQRLLRMGKGINAESRRERRFAKRDGKITQYF